MPAQETKYILGKRHSVLCIAGEGFLSIDTAYKTRFVYRAEQRSVSSANMAVTRNTWMRGSRLTKPVQARPVVSASVAISNSVYFFC